MNPACFERFHSRHRLESRPLFHFIHNIVYQRVMEIANILERVATLVSSNGDRLSYLIYYQRPDEINLVLEALHLRLSDCPSQSISFEVRHKKKQVDMTIERIRSYSGPDLETKRVLSDNATQWTLRPHLFWNTRNEQCDLALVAEAHIVRAYVQAHGDDA